jgi:hypothetical protein
MCESCKIGWIDDRGQSTYDDNPAIGYVQTIERHEWHHGRQIHFPASQWFPICAEHARQLRAPGMHIWVFVEESPNAELV